MARKNGRNNRWTDRFFILNQTWTKAFFISHIFGYITAFAQTCWIVSEIRKHAKK
jgi:hypothetical protein